jgi:hypothetical protein
MKKVLLLVASICCMMSAKAQDANNFIQKLDSVCYGSAVERLQYDDRYNCTQIKYVYENYGQEVVLSTHNFAYDNENRVVRDEYIDMTGVYNLYESTYNEQGLVAQRIRTMKYFDELVEVYKYTYEYDTEGKLLTNKGFSVNENNEWTASYRNEYIYREDGLLITMKHYLYYSSGDSWLYEVTEYYYNEDGLCVEKTTTRGEYEVVAQTLYDYDDEGYLTTETKLTPIDGLLVETGMALIDYYPTRDVQLYTYYDNYNANSGLWESMTTHFLDYDSAISTNNIAGILTYWDNTFLGKAFTPSHKILRYETDDINENHTTMTFHYSETTAVGENSKNQMSVWPNPVHEMLHLNVEDLQQVEVFTLDGKLVLSSKNTDSICVSGLAEGCYLLKVTQADGSTCFQKFVKE